MKRENPGLTVALSDQNRAYAAGIPGRLWTHGLLKLFSLDLWHSWEHRAWGLNPCVSVWVDTDATQDRLHSLR